MKAAGNFFRYFAELSGAFVLYAVLLVGANLIEARYHSKGLALIGIALLPILGCLAALWAIMRQIRRMDEMQRRIQFEALGFAFAVTALLTFSYGFLEGAGLPRFPVFAVWPLMAVSWVLGLMITARRYR
jgi:hypothetical protein